MSNVNLKVKDIMGKMLAAVGLKEAPIVDGKVAFSDEESKKLKELMSQEVYQKALDAFNKDLEIDASTADLKESIVSMLQEINVPEEKFQEIMTTAKKDGGDLKKMLEKVQTELRSYKATTEALIEKLKGLPEIDNSKTQTSKAMLQHSETHIFASGKEYDKVDRPWNNALVKGLSMSATDYSDPLVIAKLQGDSDLYFRENPQELKSLHRDNFMLPDFWPKKLGVSDRVADGSISTAEITQGRKAGWLPKNIQEIEAEEGKIYPVQIDAQWEGYQLQKIEESWLNSFNKEGSQPEKWSFVKFLVEELMKQARLEDRISTINGIFVQTPDNAEKAGAFINRQNGLFYQLWKARNITQKYRPFSMPEITPENVMDWFHSDDENTPGFLQRLPQEVKNATNGVIYMHKSVWDWYKAKYKFINGTNQDYKGLPEHLENYPNIRVEVLIDQESKQFVFFTFTDNIEILENIPAEKTSFRFQTLLRKIYLLADYKLGVRIIHIGRKLAANDPAKYKVQSVWSNDGPIFKTDTYVPIYDKGTGIVNVDFNNLQVHDSFKTNIDKFEMVYPGQIIKIKGNTSLSSSVKVKHDNDNIKLAGNQDFDLKTGGVLTLLVNNNYKLKEVKRTTIPPVISDEFEFDTTSIDADFSFKFKYSGENATLTEISNGSEGKTITIYGNENTLTIKDISGNISVGSDISLTGEDKFVELVKVDGIWHKANTNI